MRRINRKGTLAGVLGGMSCCVLSATSAWGQESNQASDTTANVPGKASAMPIHHVRVASGDEGGIAGPSPIVYDNGPLDTAEPSPECLAGSTRSTLQNQTICLSSFGSNCTNEGATIFWMADDFTLAQTTDLQTIEFYLYETSAVAATITSMNVQLHSAQPLNPASNVIQTATGGTSALTTIFRKTEAAAGVVVPSCARRVQRVTVNVSAWPDIAAGAYWLSWQATGSASAGPWQPPVTILGQFGKPGGNAMQATGAAAFLAVADIGGNPGPAGTITCAAGALVPPPPGAPQDLPFTIRGDVIGVPCDGDTDGDGDVDADDLFAVVLQWGGVCPCTGDVDGDGDVDTDDLVMVVLNWGDC